MSLNNKFFVNAIRFKNKRIDKDSMLENLEALRRSNITSYVVKGSNQSVYREESNNPRQLQEKEKSLKACELALRLSVVLYPFPSCCEVS